MDLPYHPIVNWISIFRQQDAFKKSYAQMEAYLFLTKILFYWLIASFKICLCVPLMEGF
jgi:hypothetical protein